MGNLNDEIKKIEDEYVAYFFEGQFNEEYPNTLSYPFVWPLKEEKDGIKQ